ARGETVECKEMASEVREYGTELPLAIVREREDVAKARFDLIPRRAFQTRQRARGGQRDGVKRLRDAVVQLASDPRALLQPGRVQRAALVETGAGLVTESSRGRGGSVHRTSVLVATSM